MDELMKLFANKSASSDPNDMTLSTSDPMDVNLLVGIILVTTRIEETLILGRSLVIPLIIMVIPTTILMEILIICPLILRLALKSL